MNKNIKEKLRLIAESIEKENDQISLDIETYKTIEKIKSLSEAKWKLAIPLITATVTSLIAIAVPDPFEAIEIALATVGGTTLITLFGSKIIPIILIAKYGNGIESLDSLRTDYCFVRKSQDTVYLKRRKSINATQLGFPPIIYISNGLKFDEYDDIRNIAFLTKDCASEWKNIKSIDVRGKSDFKYCKNATIFIKHPFLPKTYMELEAALNTYEIMHEKISYITTIMHSLGAKKIVGKAHFEKVETLEIKNASDIKIVDKKISAKVQKNKTDLVEKTLFINETCSGGFSEESYQRAKQIATEYGLDAEPDIKNLLIQRDPTNCNTTNSYNINTELTKEINKTLDVAVDILINGIGIRNDYKSKITNRDVITFSMNIDF